MGGNTAYQLSFAVKKRREQSEKPFDSPRSLSWIFICIGIIVFLLIVIKGVKEATDSVWDGSHHITVAVDQGKDLEIYSLEPKSHNLTVVTASSDTIFFVPPNYGEYKASALGKFSLLEKKNGSLLEHAVSDTLGIPVDGSIILSPTDGHPFVLSHLFGFGVFTNLEMTGRFLTGVTDLTYFDLVRLWLLSFSFKQDEIQTLNLTDSHVVNPVRQPDGSIRYDIDQDLLIPTAQKYFVDETIKDEDASIAIINATSTQGKANTLAFLLTNIGGNVINTSKGEARHDTFVVSNKNSYTAQKIAKIVQGKLLDQKDSTAAKFTSDNRADIVVVLGE